MNLVKVISTKVKDGYRFVKFLRYGKSDVQECNNSNPFGDDSNAPKDMIALYSETGEIGTPIIIGYLNKNQITDIGEKRIYSLKSNGDLSQYIWLKNDGTMEVGGNVDNLVRYSELETAFNKLRDDFNDFVSNSYNAHVHPSPAGGSTGTTPSIATPSTADVSGAKIEEIKTM